MLLLTLHYVETLQSSFLENMTIHRCRSRLSISSTYSSPRPPSGADAIHKTKTQYVRNISIYHLASIYKSELCIKYFNRNKNVQFDHNLHLNHFLVANNPYMLMEQPSSRSHTVFRRCPKISDCPRLNVA